MLIYNSTHKKIYSFIKKLSDNPNTHVCDWPKDAGPCSGTFSKFYFDGTSCESFDYGGCEGNANNFDSKQDCQQTCMSSTEVSPRSQSAALEKEHNAIRSQLCFNKLYINYISFYLHYAL